MKRSDRSLIVRVASVAIAMLKSITTAFAEDTTPTLMTEKPVFALKQETHTYKTVGALDIMAEVSYGAESSLPRPVIVTIHGGALMGGSRSRNLGRVAKALLDRGCVIVDIDYRLAPETKLPEIARDMIDAHNWVREKGPDLFGADPKRVATMGGSAGGYLTLLAGHRVSPPPVALVSFYGYGDITGKWYSEPAPFYCKRAPIREEEARSVVGTTPITAPPADMIMKRLEFYDYCRQQGLWPLEVAGFDPHTEDVKFTPYSPIRNVTKTYPPTLLLHGEADDDVPCQRSLDMAAELERAGVEHELATYKNGVHGFDALWSVPGDQYKEMRENALDATDRAIAFLERHLFPTDASMPHDSGVTTETLTRIKRASVDRYPRRNPLGNGLPAERTMDSYPMMGAPAQGLVAQPPLKVPWPPGIDKVDVKHDVPHPKIGRDTSPFRRLVVAIGEAVTVEPKKDLCHSWRNKGLESL